MELERANPRLSGFKRKDANNTATCIGGTAHYLRAGQTINLMQTEHVYPVCGDRTSPKDSVEIGRPDLAGKAIKRKNEILAQGSQALFPPEVEATITAPFPIKLKTS